LRALFHELSGRLRNFTKASGDIAKPAVHLPTMMVA
jgi:hypothetical protein